MIAFEDSFFSNCGDMDRILVICLQTALFAFTCTVMSQILDSPSTATSLTDKPWFHAINKKILRQGMNPDHTPDPSLHKTEPPPKRDCICSKIYDPVCASNNESYFNLCFLECKVPRDENVTVVHQGNCIPF